MHPPAWIRSLNDRGADDLVSSFAASLIRRGWRIGGLVQLAQPGPHGCNFSLLDLARGTRYPITQNLGEHAEACRIDTASLAEASCVYRRIAEEGADLVIFNRFSSLEAQGQGFSAEMLQLMSQGLASLSIVPERHIAAWHEFTGHVAIELPATRVALEAWFDGVVASTSPGD